MEFIEKINNDMIINESDVLKFEKLIGRDVPDVLRDFYRSYNGASIKLCIFDIDGYDFEVFEILPLVHGKCCVEKIYEDDREDGYIRESLIPLANNSGGDYYYWDKNDEKIYLIYCDDIENEILIADSKEDFFDIMNKNIEN